MDILRQVIILFFVTFLGESLSRLLPFPVPGTIVSLLLFIFFLFTGLIKEEHVKEKTQFLFRYMSLVFLPPAINLLKHLDVLGQLWWKLLILCLLSTLFTFTMTALSYQILKRIFLRPSARRERV